LPKPPLKVPVNVTVISSAFAAVLEMRAARPSAIAVERIAVCLPTDEIFWWPSHIVEETFSGADMTKAASRSDEAPAALNRSDWPSQLLLNVQLQLALDRRRTKGSGRPKANGSRWLSCPARDWPQDARSRRRRRRHVHARRATPAAFLQLAARPASPIFLWSTWCSLVPQTLAVQFDLVDLARALDFDCHSNFVFRLSAEMQELPR
jgi:hypothetical protein